MNTLLTKAGLGIALAATTLSIAAPADAQRYRRHYRGGGGDVATGALVGGIVGLGIGAAIASSNRDRYYDRGYYGEPPRRYYRDRYYAPPRGYYGRSYGYDRGYYPPPRYYAPGYGYGGGYGW